MSLRLVEEMLLERGIVVSYQTIRRWGIKFGPHYARRLRRKQHSRNDVWRLDEVVITIAGRKHWLWRAVDQDGYVPDEIVQNRRNTKAAKRLLTRLLKKQGVAPEAHDNRQAALLWSSQATGDAGRRASVAQGIEQPGGECTCAVAKTGAGMMQGFRSPGRLQRFVSIFSALRNSSSRPRSKRSALATHIHRLQAMAESAPVRRDGCYRRHIQGWRHDGAISTCSRPRPCSSFALSCRPT